MKNLISVFVFLLLSCGTTQKMYAQNTNTTPLVSSENNTANCKGIPIFSSKKKDPNGYNLVDICEEWRKETYTLTTFTTTALSDQNYRKALKQVIYFEDVDESMILSGLMDNSSVPLYEYGNWMVSIMTEGDKKVYEYEYLKNTFRENKTTVLGFFLKTEKEATAFVEKFKKAVKNAKAKPGNGVRPTIGGKSANEVASYKPIYFKKAGEIIFSIYYDKSTASSLNTKVYRGDKAKLLFTTYSDVYKGQLSKTAKFENCSYCSIHSISDVGTGVITIKNKPNSIQYQMMYKDNDWYLIKGTGTNTEVDYKSNFDKIQIGYTSGDGDIYGKSAMSIESEVKLNAKTKLWVMAMLHMAGYIGDDGTFGN